MAAACKSFWKGQRSLRVQKSCFSNSLRIRELKSIRRRRVSSLWKSIQKKLQLHSISINYIYIYLYTENIRKHPLAPKVQRVAAGLASQIVLPAAEHRFFEVSRKFTGIGSRLQGMDHGWYGWAPLKSVEICWNQVESNGFGPENVGLIFPMIASHLKTG